MTGLPEEKRQAFSFRESSVSGEFQMTDRSSIVCAGKILLADRKIC